MEQRSQSTSVSAGQTRRLLSLSKKFPAALGTDHLSSAYIEEESKQFSATRTYGRGIVEEASGWGQRSRTFTEEGAVSEGTGSESAQNSDSTPRSAGELQSLFRFARDDCILIVDDSTLAHICTTDWAER